ncbi:hypothetical protein D3C85_738790 [compost metagenome]
MVTKGPPSIGQFTICGSLLILVFKNLFLADGVLNGSADNADMTEPAYLKGFFKALIGSLRNETNCCTLGKVSLKINLDLSSVPNKLETAGKGLPFTFSKRIAGP